VITLDDRLKCCINPQSENILYLFSTDENAKQAFREYKFVLDIRTEKYKYNLDTLTIARIAKNGRYDKYIYFRSINYHGFNGMRFKEYNYGFKELEE
jgi:hypothetical protein